MLNVTIQRVRGVVTLRCTGRIVRGDETTILCAAIHQHARELNFDLSGVTAIDAGGIGALLSLQAAGIYLRLINPTAAVREVLRLTKLDSVFEISEAQATNESVAANGFRISPSVESSCAVLQEN